MEEKEFEERPLVIEQAVDQNRLRTRSNCGRPKTDRQPNRCVGIMDAHQVSFLNSQKHRVTDIQIVYAEWIAEIKLYSC